MADENDSTTVSREAHDRIKTERDEYKAKVDELSATVKDLAYRDKARSWFASKGVDDAGLLADLALPHLRDIDPDKIEETLSSDRFKPLIAQPKANTDQEGEPPIEPPTSGFSGPSPGTPGGTPPTPQKLEFKSQEVQDAILRGDRTQLDQWDSEGRINWDPRVIALESPTM